MIALVITLSVFLIAFILALRLINKCPNCGDLRLPCNMTQSQQAHCKKCGKDFLWDEYIREWLEITKPSETVFVKLETGEE